MSPASMDHTSVVPRTFSLLLKIHSKSSEKTVKRLLQGIQGVQSVVMNRKQGIVTIAGIVDPPTITLMLEKYGFKAELLGEQVFRAKNGGNEQIIAESEVVVERFDDQKTVEQIQKLSALKNLKAIEHILVTQKPPLVCPIPSRFENQSDQVVKHLKCLLDRRQHLMESDVNDGTDYLARVPDCTVTDDLMGEFESSSIKKPSLIKVKI